MDHAVEKENQVVVVEKTEPGDKSQQQRLTAIIKKLNQKNN